MPGPVRLVSQSADCLYILYPDIFSNLILTLSCTLEILAAHSNSKGPPFEFVVLHHSTMSGPVDNPARPDM